MVLYAPKFGNRFENLVASGWELATIFTATTGPTSPSPPEPMYTLAGTGNSIAYNVFKPYGTRSDFGKHGYLTPNVAGATIQTSTWAAPATGAFSYQRPLSLFGPSSYEWDLSLSRNFSLSHRVRRFSSAGMSSTFQMRSPLRPQLQPAHSATSALPL
jgi:hypothetical protein